MVLYHLLPPLILFYMKTSLIKLLLISLIAILFLQGCGESYRLDNPIPETYSVDITAISIADNIDFYVDGVQINPLNINNGDYLRETYLKSKGDRKLEIRNENGANTIHTITLNQDTTLTLYWNGKEITDKLVLPTPSPDHYGVVLRMDTIAASNSVGPVDIEMYAINFRYGTFEFNEGKPFHVVKNYTFTEVMPYFELDKALIDSKGRYDKVIFRMVKAGTQENYYPSNVTGFADVRGGWADLAAKKEYWVRLQYFNFNDLVLDKTVMFILKQGKAPLVKNADRLKEYGYDTVIHWDETPEIIVSE